MIAVRRQARWRLVADIARACGWLALAYVMFALAVFYYRNPTANTGSLFRHFGPVIRFEKMPAYQLPAGAP